MSEQQEPKFLVEKQWWFMSCLSIHEEPNYEAELNLFEGNSGEIKNTKLSTKMQEKAQKLEEIANKRLIDANENYFVRVDEKDIPSLVEIAHSMTVKCIWHPYFKVKTKYFDMKVKDYIEYHTLGYFEFEIIIDNKGALSKLTSKYVQQFPNLVKGFSEIDVGTLYNWDRDDMEILLDTKSPMYVYMVSRDCGVPNPVINDDFIEKNRKELGYWANVYSGQFDDYSDKTFRERLMFDTKTHNFNINLSHRKNELHLINRNNALVYLDKDNYGNKTEENFDNYHKKYKFEHPPNNNLRKYLQLPIARMRAILFQLLIIIDVLDDLDVKIQEEYKFKDKSSLADIYHAQQFLSTELQNVRISFSRIDQVYNNSYFLEIGYNRRDLYKNNIYHLYELFKIKLFTDKLEKKVKKIDDHLNQLISRMVDERNKRKQMLIQILGILISVYGILEIIDSLVTSFPDFAETAPFLKVGLVGVVFIINLYLSIKYIINRKYF